MEKPPFFLFVSVGLYSACVRSSKPSEQMKQPAKTRFIASYIPPEHVIHSRSHIITLQRLRSTTEFDCECCVVYAMQSHTHTHDTRLYYMHLHTIMHEPEHIWGDTQRVHIDIETRENPFPLLRHSATSRQCLLYIETVVCTMWLCHCTCIFYAILSSIVLRASCVLYCTVVYLPSAIVVRILCSIVYVSALYTERHTRNIYDIRI